MRKLGVTQELLSLVTGLAHYLKLLIRIGLQGALRLERERQNVEGLYGFLEILANLDSVKDSEKYLDLTTGASSLADQRSDLCFKCEKPIDDECVKLGQRRWHAKHLDCHCCQRTLGDSIQDALWSSREVNIICRECNDKQQDICDAQPGFENVTRLQQYVYLLRVALARLVTLLRSGGTLPHTSGKPRLIHFTPFQLSNEIHRRSKYNHLRLE